MQQLVTRKGLRIIVWVVILGIAAVILLLSLPVNVRNGDQWRNMEAARKHGMLITPLIHSDPRFTAVEFSAFTGNGGSLSVGGRVVSENDFQALKVIVEASKPPVHMVYFLEITEALRVTEKHGKYLASLIHSDPRFTDIQFFPTTDGRTLDVIGRVASEADCRELERIIDASKPPGGVIYSVQITR